MASGRPAVIFDGKLLRKNMAATMQEKFTHLAARHLARLLSGYLENSRHLQRKLSSDDANNRYV